MKLVFVFLFLVISIFPSLSYSMIGEQYSSIVQRYGKPDSFDEKDRIAYWENHTEGYTIRIYFHRDGWSGFEVYTSMIDREYEMSIFMIKDLTSKFSNEIPKLNYTKIRFGETYDFGGISLNATLNREVHISPVTQMGRIAVVTEKEESKLGACMIIYKEGFGRSLVNRIDRRATKR